MPVDPPQIAALKAACGQKAPFADEIFAEADEPPVQTLERVTVGGRSLVHLLVTYAGHGRWMSWSNTHWLVDPTTCRAVALESDGGAGTLEEQACFRGTTSPTAEEHAWLLQMAEYVAWDPARDDQVLATLSFRPAPALPRSTVLLDPNLTVTRVDYPPPDWHAGRPPTLAAAWRRLAPTKQDGDPRECYAVHLPEGLKASATQPVGGMLLHRLETEARVVTTAFVLEDPIQVRWAAWGGTAFEASAIGAQEHSLGRIFGNGPPVADPAPPAALAEWSWSQNAGFQGVGVESVVAVDHATGARVAFELSPPPESLTWTTGGLLVTPEDGAPVLVPTAVLQRR